MILRTLAFILLCGMVFPACSDKSETVDMRFWSWFESCEAELANIFSYETGVLAQEDAELQKKIEDAVAEVGRKLREEHPEFSPFFGFSEGVNKLIITVNGQVDYFTAVDEFIASAPEIEGWSFIALKQPLTLSADTEIQSGTAKLKVGDWSYLKTQNEDGTFDFVIYVSNQVFDDLEGFGRLFTSLTIDS